MRDNPLLLAAGCLLVAGLLAMAFDVSIARWIADDGIPGGLRKLVHLCEPFGHGLGVLLLLALLHQLDPARRWALPRVAACAWGAGMTANVVKMLVERSRPHAAELAGTVWGTFGQWIPGVSAGSSGQSFPSAHTATAVGLAAALVWLYPRGRIAFPALAALVACQRVASASHFLSDVFCGAAVGLVAVRILLGYGVVADWFDTIESRWKTFRKQPLDAADRERLERLLAEDESDQANPPAKAA